MIIRGIMITDLLAHAGKIFLALFKTRIYSDDRFGDLRMTT